MLYFQPEDWTTALSLLVESDAPTNAQAVQEIDGWAIDNGFARTNEYWLRQIRRDGQTLFQGVCFRVTEEHRAAATDRLTRIADRIASLPTQVLVED